MKKKRGWERRANQREGRLWDGVGQPASSQQPVLGISLSTIWWLLEMH